MTLLLRKMVNISLALSVMEGFIIVQNPQGKETIIVRNILSREVGESIEFGVPTGGKTHSVRFLKFVMW